MPGFGRATSRAHTRELSDRGWMALLLTSTAIVATTALMSGKVSAQSPSVSAQKAAGEYAFNIPRQSLASAMIAFQRATGISVLADGSVPQNVMSPGVSGARSASGALQRMLAGTGLSYSISGNTARIFNPGAGSNTTAATIDGAIALDTIDVSGGGRPALADIPYQTPGSSGYISEEQIKRVMPMSTGDMLKSTPGVMSAGNRNGVSMDVNIRGMQGMNRVATSIDGAQQQSSSYRGYGGFDSRVYVDPEFIAGIDVGKGPGKVAGAMGGAVDMRTLSARDLVGDGESVVLRLRGGMANNDTTPFDGRFVGPGVLGPIGGDGWPSMDSSFGSTVVGVVAGNFDLLAGQAYRRKGNYFAGTNGPVLPKGGTEFYQRYSPYYYGEEINNTFQTTSSTLLKLGWRPTSEHHLELGYNRYKSKYGEAYADEFAGTSSTKYDLLSTVDAATYTARYTWKPVDNPLFHLRANVWASDVHNNWPAPIVSLDTKTFTSGADLRNTSQFTLPLGVLSLTYGGEYIVEDSKYTNALLPQPSGSSTDGVRKLSSVFALAKYEPFEWLRLDAGIRREHYSLDGLPEKDGSAVLPSAGIAITPLKGLQAFATYAEGWRPPTIRETRLTVATAFGTTLLPNPDLDPERSVNKEIGINFIRDRLFFDRDKLRLKVAYFDNDYQDYIVRHQAPLPRTYKNIASAHMKGVEISGSYDMGTFFAEVAANQYTDVTYCAPETATSQVVVCGNRTGGDDFGAYYVPPKYSGMLTLGVRLLDRKLTLGSRMTIAGERSLARSSNYTVSDWAAYKVLDLFGSYKVNDHSTIDFSIENVTDRFYVDALTDAKMPAPGRTARVSFTMELGKSGSYATDFALPKLATPESGFDWTGAFIGLQGSYSYGNATESGDVAGTLRTGTSSANYVWVPYGSTVSTKQDAGAVTGSVYLGYNLQLGSPLVFGIDANLGSSDRLVRDEQFTSAVVSTVTGTPRTLTTTVSSAMDWQGAVRGRAGLAFDNRTMLYVAGGIAMASYSYDYAAFAMTGSTTTRTLPNPISMKGTYMGWTLGGGIEHAMTSNIVLRAEFNYRDFGTETFDTPYGQHRIDLTSSEWKLGAAYKF